MSKLWKYTLTIGIVMITAVLLPMTGFSQPDAGCDPLDPACPIDGGLSLLIAAGIGLGAKKAISNARKKNL